MHLNDIDIFKNSLEKGPLFTDLGEFNNIIITGSSNSGKSFIADIFREHPLHKTSFYVAHRYVTRAARNGINQTLENTHLSNEEFDRYLESHHIGPYWVRYMEKIGEDQTRRERYGFESDGCIKDILSGKEVRKIYSANNDFIRRMYDKKESNVDTFIDNSCVIFVDCPRDLRAERMMLRADDLLRNNPNEAQYRLGDEAADIKNLSHIIIKNYGIYESLVKEDIYNFINTIF